MTHTAFKSALWTRNFWRSLGWQQFAICFLVLGIFLRTLGYVAGGSLELDELNLTRNLFSRSFADLFKPLDYNQIAPVGWLFLQKAALDIWSNIDYSARFPAFVFGVAGVALMYVAAKRTLQAPGVFLTVAVMALSPFAIRYSFFVKPYTGDIFFSLLVLFLALDLIRCERPSILRLMPFLFAGLIGVILSFPVVILLASAGSALFLKALITRDNRLVVSTVAISLAWLLLFLSIYLMMPSNSSGVVSWMREEAWDNTFAPIPFTSLSSLIWYPSNLLNKMSYLFSSEGGVFAGLLYLVGLFHLYTSSRYEALVLLTFPLIIALLISILHLYPFEDRLILYLLPMFVLGIGYGFDYLITESRQTFLAPLLLGIGLVIALGWKAFSGFNQPFPPFATENVHPAMQVLSEEAMPDDLVYVYYGAIPAHRIYSGRYDTVSELETVDGRTPQFDWNCYLMDVQKLRNKGRVWVFFSVIRRSEDKIFLNTVKRISTIVEEYRFQGVRLLLLDFADDKADVSLLLQNMKEPDEAICRGYWS